MFRAVFLARSVLLSLLISSCCLGEIPTPAEISKAYKKCVETRSDLQSAVKGSFNRAETNADLENIHYRGGELMGVMDLNLERLEHLRTLSLIVALEGDNDSLKTWANAAAKANGKRITRLIEGNLKIVEEASENAKDPAIIATASNVKDRVREVRDLWTKCY